MLQLCRSPESLPRPSSKDKASGEEARRYLFDEEDKFEEDDEDPPQPADPPPAVRRLAQRVVENPEEEAGDHAKSVHAEDVMPDQVKIHSTRNGLQEVSKQRESRRRRHEVRSAERRLARKQKSQQKQTSTFRSEAPESKASDAFNEYHGEMQTTQSLHPQAKAEPNSTCFLETALHHEQDKLYDIEAELSQDTRGLENGGTGSNKQQQQHHHHHHHHHHSSKSITHANDVQLLSQYDLTSISEAEDKVPTSQKRRVRKQVNNNSRVSMKAQHGYQKQDRCKLIERQQQFKIHGPRAFDPVQIIDFTTF